MLFLLDANVRTVKWNGIPLHESSSAIVKEESNSDFYLTVRYPITDSGIYQLIKEDMLIKAPTPVLGAQLFRIKKPIENDDSLDITAYHVSDDIMKRSITPVSVVGQSCAMALSQMVQNAKTDLGDFSFTSDIMDSRTFNTTETETLYSVLMDGKHSIVGTWEGELVRDNFALSIKRSRGADRGVVITTHKNLKSYQRTKNSQGVVTRIHARSTFKPDGAEDEVTLRVTVDSPLINSYPYINEKEYENNNAETVEDLRKWAEAKFTNEGIDKVSDAIEIEAYELDGQVVHLGDTVNLKSRKHNVDVYKKAIAYEFNCLANDGKGEYISITFDDKPGVGGSGISSGLSNAADAILGASATAQDVAIERAVKNANAAFDAEFDKRKTELEDSIEQVKAEAEQYTDTIKQSIDQQFAEVNAIMEANEAEMDRQTKEVLAKVGASTDLANTAKRIAEEAKAGYADAVSKAQQIKSDLEGQLATTKATVNQQAQQLANQAQAQTELQTLVKETKKTADGAKTTLTELSKTVNTATGNLDTVTQRVASVESGLTGVREQYQSVQTTLDSQTQAVRNVTSKTADLERGLDGVRDRFDNIRVGGVNLLRNSSFAKDMQDWVVIGAFEKSEEPFGHHRVAGELRQSKSIRQSIFEQIKDDPDDQIYTFSVDVKVDNIVAGTRDPFLRIYFDGSRNSQWYGVTYLPGAQIDIGNYNNRGWQRLTGQIRFPSRVGMTSSWASLYFRDFTGSVSFRKFKLERGTIPTDYSPDEEDFRHEFAEYKRTATENSAELGRKLQSLDGTLSDTKTLAQQTADSIKLLATKVDVDQDGRITRAESSISQNSEEIAKRLTRAEVDSLVDDRGLVSSTVFDNYKRETAQSIERQLTETRALIPTEVGGENLLKNSLFTKTSQAPERFTVAGVTYVNKYAESWSNFYNTGIGNPTTSYHAYLNETFISGTPVVEFNESDGTRQWKGINQRIAPGKLIGRDYHFSVDSYATGPGTKFWFGFYYFNKSGRRDFHAGTTTVIPTAVNQWQRLGGVIKLNDDVDTAKDILFYFYAYEFTSNAILYIKRPKLERGKIGTDHSLALEDMVTTVDFNRVRETSRLYERIIGSTEGDVTNKIARMAMTSELFMTEVGKALASSENLVYDPTRYSKYQPRNATSRPVLASYAMYSAMRISHSGLTADQFNGFRLPLRTSTFTAGEKLSLRAVIGIDALPDSGGQIKFEIKNQGAIIAYFWLNPTKVGNNQVFTATTTVQVSTASVDEYGLDILINRNGNVNITQISLVRGDRPPDSFADDTSAQEIAVSTQVDQLAGSYAIKNITEAGDIINGINLGANGNNRIIGKATHITGETLIDKAVIKSAMVDKLKTANFESGSVTTTILATNAVTAEKLLVDQALFNKLMANEAYLKQLFAKNAFITQVQAITLSAKKISGGILRALNGNMEINLDNGQILYYTDQAALKRILGGYPTQFIKFDTGVVQGKGNAGVTVIGSNRNRTESSNDGGFVGIRAWNGNQIDSLDLVGDSISMVASAFDSPQGFEVDTWNGGRSPVISTLGSNAQKRDARIEIGDVWLYYNYNGQLVSLKQVLDNIFANFRGLSDAGAFDGRNYYSHWN